MFVMPPTFNSGDTIYFPFDTYDANGASVTITGLAVTDIEVYKNGSTTQRTSDNGYTLLDTDGIDFDSTTGLHGFSIDTSDNSDAGFWADGAQYWINVNAITVDGQTVRFTYFLALGYLLRPTTAGRKLDVSSGGEAGLDWANIGSPTTTVGLSGTTVKTATDVETDTADIQTRLPAALGANGNIKADVRDYNGTAGTFSGGRPEVNTTHWGGTAVASATVNANMTQISGDSTAADNLEADFDGTGYALYLRRATAQAGAAASITLDASASATTDLYKGLIVELIGGTGAGQARLISAYNGTTKVASILPNWETSPDGTTVFQLHPNARVDVSRWVGTTVNGLVSGNVPCDVVSISGDSTAADNLEAMLDGTGGVTLSAAISGNITGNLSGSVGSVTGAVGSVTGAVGSVGSGGITAASFGAGAIDAAAIAASAVTEIVTGVLTTQMTEAYAADTVAPTLAQSLFRIMQNITEFAISGTTLTAKKLDKSTTAETYTLDSATTPTSRTRAT